MTDEMDQAQAMQDHYLHVALQNKRPELKAVGRCYNCEESVPEGHRFCDADCRNDYEKRNRH